MAYKIRTDDGSQGKTHYRKQKGVSTPNSNDLRGRIQYRKQAGVSKPNRIDLEAEERDYEKNSLLDSLRKPAAQAEEAPEREEEKIGFFTEDNSPETRESVSNKRALLAGATPLLVGFLSGNMGEGLDIAGQALLDEDQRKMKEDGTLMAALQKSIDKSKEKAGSSKFSPAKARSGKGLAFEKSTGKYIDPDTGRPVRDARLHRFIESGDVYDRARSREGGKLSKGVYGSRLTEDREGVKYKYNLSSDKKQKVFNDSKYKVSPNFEKRSNAVVDRYTADMKPIRDIAQSLNEASVLLKSDGQLPNKIAIQHIVKKVEVGTMSDGDRAYYKSNISLLKSISERWNEEFDETIRARLKEEGAEVLKVLLEFSDKRLYSEAERRTNQNARDKNEGKYLMDRMQGKGFAGKPKISAPSRKSRSLRSTKDLSKFEKGIDDMSLEELEALENQVKGNK